MNLPPLPEKAVKTYSVLNQTVEVHGYTETQMLALRAATVEACAKVCEEHLQYPSLTPKHCADAIRGLK